MDAAQANKARKLYQKEVAKLVDAGMPDEHASVTKFECCNDLTSLKHIVCEPILSSMEDQNPEQYEVNHEEKFSGKVPDSIVGLEFHGIVDMKDIHGNDIEVEMWEKVLMNLASDLLQSGILTTRQLSSLDKAEGFSK